MKITSHSVSETESFAKKYIGDVVASRSGGVNAKAFVIGLYGNLGSGKTAFAQALAKTLGVKDYVTSPTFVIEKIYPLVNSLSTAKTHSPAQVYSHSPQVFTHLIHIDAYRLESSDEMKHLGWENIAADPGNLIVIEWPEKIAGLLPADHDRIKFTFVDATTREIEIKAKMVQ